MREHDENSNFQIGNEPEGAPEISFRDELEDLRIEKLGQRVTFITILIPCLIGAILFVGYMDISKRVNSAQSEGSVEMANLTRTIESRLDVLNENHRALKESTDKSLPELSRKSSALESDIKALAASVKKNTSGKVDLSYYKKESSRLKKQAASMAASLPKVKKGVEKLTRSVAQDREKQKIFMDSTSEEITGLNLSLDQVKTSLSLSIDEKISRDELSSALEEKAAALENRLNSSMDDNLRETLNRLSQLEKDRAAMKEQLLALKSTLERKDRALLLMDKRIKEMESRSKAQENPGLIIEEDLSN